MVVVPLVSCSSVAMFFKRLHRLFVEGRGEQGCTSLCPVRAKLEGFDSGGGDVVGVILAKLGKRDGRHVLIVYIGDNFEGGVNSW